MEVYVSTKGDYRGIIVSVTGTTALYREWQACRGGQRRVAVARLTDTTGLLEESLELTDNAGIDEMVAVAQRMEVKIPRLCLPPRLEKDIPAGPQSLPI